MSAPTPSSYADWIMSEGFMPLAKEHRFIAETGNSILRVMVARASPDPPTPDVTIQLGISGGLTWRWDFGAGRNKAPFASGDIVVTPDGRPLDAEGDGRCELLVFTLPGDQLRQLTAGTGAPDLDVLSRTFRDARLATLLRWIWEEGEAGSPDGRLFIDGATAMIAARLVTLSTGRRTFIAGGLAPFQLKRVQSLLQDGLHRNISLAELASEVALSEAHLSRAFKVSTGLAPWRWLAERRIERARELLADPRMSLTDIAQRVGYSGQGPFGEAFRRATGRTPGQYRRDMLR